MSEIISDVMPFEYQIVESANGGFRVEGVFQRSDVENANKRVYPRNVWEKVLADNNTQSAMESRAMFGELDHPADGKTSLKRVAHIITDLHLNEDGTVTGGAEILPTPNGQILKTLFESGVQVGISSRGSGSVRDGRVQEDFKLSTFDFVARPSTPGAIPRPKSGANESRRSRRTYEDTQADDVLVVTGSEEGIENMSVEDLFKELDSLDFSLQESAETVDFNHVAERVITLYNALTERDGWDQEFLQEAHDEALELSGVLAQLAVEYPQHGKIISELQDRVNESWGAVVTLQPINENSKEEPMDEKLQFVLDRMNDADERDSVDLSEAEELYNELDSLSDEDLLDVALEAGVVEFEEDEDIEEGDGDIDLDDIDVEALLDYVQDQDEQLAEAEEIIEGLVVRIEESADVDVNDLLLKYETSLGIIQETALQYQLLQEAVGGKDRADDLIEAHVQKLELTDYDEAGNVTEDLDNDDARVVQSILEDDGVKNDRVSRSVALFESAKGRFGALN